MLQPTSSTPLTLQSFEACEHPAHRSRRTTIARVTVSPVCSDRLAQYARHSGSQQRRCVRFLKPPAPPLYRACENQESGTYAATLKGNNHAARICPPGGRPPPVREWLPRLRGPCTMGEGSRLRNLRRQLMALRSGPQGPPRCYRLDRASRPRPGQARRGLRRLDREGPDNASSTEGAGNPARNGRGQTCRPECGREPDQGGDRATTVGRRIEGARRATEE